MRKKLRLVDNPRDAMRTSSFRLSFGGACSAFIGALADVALSHWGDISERLLIPVWMIWVGGGALCAVIAIARVTRWVFQEDGDGHE